MNAVMQEVVCSNCGRGLGEDSDEIGDRLGPCCENLPAPWVRHPETGLYGVARPRREPAMPPPPLIDLETGAVVGAATERPTVPRCGECGGEHFIVHLHCTEYHEYRLSVSADPDEDEGATLVIDAGNFSEADHWDVTETDGYEFSHVSCSNCNRLYTDVRLD